MKKRFFAIILALTLCAGLVTPAFAEDTESVTVAGITFDAIATDQHESYRDFLEEYVAEGYSWAPAQLAAAGPEVDLLYNLGLINYGPEDGVRHIWAYLVDDDVTLDFHVKEGDKITIEGYYLSIGEHKAVDEPVYVATSMGSWTFPAKKDGALVDKDFFDQNYPGVNYIYCYRGDYNPNIDEEETLSIVFADKNGIPRTIPAFSDVAGNAYYAIPVAWAVAKEITTGTGNNKFSPNQDCTNAQILTFIWRAYGKPEPTIDNPFTNSIPDGYKKAAVWAHEKGMVSGTTFDTDKPCTRAMAMTYLWQAAGSPTAPAASFTDVSADAAYASAVAWAVEQKITTGTGTGTTFSPDDVCSRGQIMTFLHRNLAKS